MTRATPKTPFLPVELDLDDIRGQQFRLDNVQLHVPCAETNDLVQRVDDAWPNEEDPEPK